MIFLQIIPQLIHIAAPVTPHQQKILSVEIFHRQSVPSGQPVVDGYGAAQRLPGQLQPRALTQAQHGFIKNPGQDVYKRQLVYSLFCPF